MEYKQPKTKFREEMEEIIAKEGNEYKFDHKGIECEIIRVKDSQMFHWCGYVKTGLNCDLTDSQKYELSVHGGVTYNYDGIVGFDCAHCCDIYAFYNETMPVFMNNAIYRDKEYVINETKSLAEQVKSRRLWWKIENFIELVLNKIGLTLLKNKKEF
jgi:hypothetical protein